MYPTPALVKDYAALAVTVLVAFLVRRKTGWVSIALVYRQSTPGREDTVEAGLQEESQHYTGQTSRAERLPWTRTARPKMTTTWKLRVRVC